MVNRFAASMAAAGGSITMPLIGAVPARGRTPAGLASEITAKLRNGYIRDPSVAVEMMCQTPLMLETASSTFFVTCDSSSDGAAPDWVMST